jgi:glycosyltransferase involved in cell wall biosynthesis
MHYTSELERDLAATLGLRPPSLVVPNGVDLREFADLPDRGFLRQRFSQIGERRIVLFLSRIHPKKGLDLLVEAFARAGTAGRVLVITGPDCDGYEAEIRRLVRARNVDESVIFTGPLYGRDRIAALRDADLFALPSHQENFGIAVVEALAAGVPVLISDQVNIYREIQEENVGGVVRMDVDELARALDCWLSDDAMRSAAATRARPLARNRYDWSKIAGRWITEYERLVGPSKSEQPLAAAAVNIK